MKNELIKYINKNGHKKILDRAMKIVKKPYFKEMTDEAKKEKYIK